MASKQYPLQVPDDLLEEVRTAASEAGTSVEEVMRQTIKIGLPKFRDQLKGGQGLQPFTKIECREAFGPDPEWEALEAAMSQRPPPKPEPD